MEVFLLRPLQGTLCRNVLGFPLNNLFPHIEEIICTDATAAKADIHEWEQGVVEL